VNDRDRTILAGFIAPILIGVGAGMKWGLSFGLLSAGGVLIFVALLCKGPRGD